MTEAAAVQCPCCHTVLTDVSTTIVPGRLSDSERQLFDFLMEHVGQRVPTKRLVSHMYGWREDGGPQWADQTVRVLIHRLRKKLNGFPIAVVNEYGGYRMRRTSGWLSTGHQTQ